MSEKISTYKDLVVWKKSIELVTVVYSISKKFPGEEKFGLISQLNRAAASIPCNIAEGWGRELSKNYLQFLRVARGSTMELETLLLISKNLDYIKAGEYQEITNQLEEVGKMLHGLIKSIENKIKLIASD